MKTLKEKIDCLEDTINNLETILASGAMSVSVDGETTVFQNPDQIRTTLRDKRNELSILKSQQLQRPIFGCFDLR